MAKRKPSTNKPQNAPEMESAMGGGDEPFRGDASGAGIPGGDLDMRTQGRFDKGDVEKDRKKLFPEAKTHRRKSSGK